MLEVRVSDLKDLDAVYKVHQNCINELANSSELGAVTFLDKRSKEEFKKVIEKGYSFAILFNNKVVGYFLFDTFRDGLISKGLVLENEVQGLGLVKLVHKLHNGIKKYYIVSKYNTKSLKNILSLELRYLETVNESDSLYG